MLRSRTLLPSLLPRLSKTFSSTCRMSSPIQDVYVAVTPSGSPTPSVLSAGAMAEIERLWRASRATDKPGETRAFYGVDGKTVVAVSTGKLPGDENSLKEVVRKNVRSLRPPPLVQCVADLLVNRQRSRRTRSRPPGPRPSRSTPSRRRTRRLSVVRLPLGSGTLRRRRMPRPSWSR